MNGNDERMKILGLYLIRYICVDCAKILKSEIMKNDIIFVDGNCDLCHNQKKVAEPKYFMLSPYNSQTYIDMCLKEHSERKAE